MGLTGYSLTRANKREKDAERSDEEMRLKSAKRSARVELQRTARNIRDMLDHRRLSILLRCSLTRLHRRTH